MKPYYEASGVTVYHGDCREVMPGLGKVDLVLTDPPYGIGCWSSTGGNSLSGSECAMINKWDKAPTDEILRAAIGAAKQAIVWGGNYFPSIWPSRSPLIWDKKIRGMHFADGEMAWTNFNYGTLRIFEKSVGASYAANPREHPTQKPLELMSWCINLADSPQTILDPFMGSGTTLRAAKDLGRRAIGIEIEERYCEIAARRMSQEVLAL